MEDVYDELNSHDNIQQDSRFVHYEFLGDEKKTKNHLTVFDLNTQFITFSFCLTLLILLILFNLLYD